MRNYGMGLELNRDGRGANGNGNVNGNVNGNGNGSRNGNRDGNVNGNVNGNGNGNGSHRGLVRFLTGLVPGFLSECVPGFTPAFASFFLCVILCALSLQGCAALPVNDTSASGAVSQDYTYVPEGFTFSGGSGRVEISCGRVEVKDGKARAVICFDSPNYEYVKVDGEEYDVLEDSAEDESAFSIPVVLGEEFEISALTTAMSTPHEIDYVLFIPDMGAASAGNGGAAGGSGDGGAAGEAPALQTASFVDPASLEAYGFKLTGRMEPKYASCFEVYYYGDGSRLIEVKDSAQYLILPEGREAEASLPEGPVVIKEPLDRLYMAATSAMSLFFAIGEEDRITLTGTDVSGWDIEGPGEAIEAGRMKYSGKYSAPDYELLVGEGCDLAIENTMILHTPEVKEKIEDLGIPVFIDTSSYENDPLGRVEWIRLYGAMTGEQEKADEFFASQEKMIRDVAEAVSGGDVKEDRRVAIFALTTQGTVTVRRLKDYMVRMVEMAGGEYAFTSLPERALSGGTETVSMEEFYNVARDADYLIYNSTIEGTLKDLDELVEKDSLFAQFKAVKEGNVWQLGRNMYQSTDTAGQFTRDVYLMLTGGDESEMSFLSRLNEGRDG